LRILGTVVLLLVLLPGQVLGGGGWFLDHAVLGAGYGLGVFSFAKPTYRGTNPRREFDAFWPSPWNWNSRTSALWAEGGISLSWVTLTLRYETIPMQAEKERFMLENSQTGIVISIPTTDLQAQGLFLRAELPLLPSSGFSPFVSFQVPLYATVKTLTYNSDPEPELVHYGRHKFNLVVEDYENITLSRPLILRAEAGFRIRVKGRLQVKLYAKGGYIRWRLHYMEQRLMPVEVGAAAGIY